MDANDTDLVPWCVQYILQNKLVFPYIHEIINATICMSLLIYLFYNGELRRTYMTNLIPFLLIQIMNSFSRVVLYAMPFASCYRENPWKVSIPIFILNTAFTIKPYVILNSLLRFLLTNRFPVFGLPISIAIPLIIMIVPALQFIFVLEFNFLASLLYFYIYKHGRLKIPGYIMCATGFANLIIAVYIIRTDQADGSLFPLLAAVYEGLYAIPEIMKFSFIFQFFDYDVYHEIEALDDYSFFAMACAAACILLWMNRKSLINRWFSSKSNDDAEFLVLLHLLEHRENTLNEEILLPNTLTDVYASALVEKGSFDSSIMSSNLHVRCIFYITEYAYDRPYKHEIVNACICGALIAYIMCRLQIRNAYKADLLPLLFIQLVYSSSQISLNTNVLAPCFRVVPYEVAIPTLIQNIAFTIKPYFILHSLIREPLRKRCGVFGLITSILIPLILVILVPALNFILSLELVDYMTAEYIHGFTGVLNFAIAVCIIKTGQSNGSSFPILVIVYEGLYAIPEIIKYAIAKSRHPIIAYRYGRILVFKSDNGSLYHHVDGIDDFSFFVMAVLSFWILVYKMQSEKLSRQLPTTKSIVK